MRNWPKKYADWADGEPEQIANQKHSAIMTLDGVKRIIQSAEFVNCLENNWPGELHLPICDLIEASFVTFYNNTLRTAARVSRTEVSHAEFISTLDKWLDMYSDLEDKFSNCPFTQGMFSLFLPRGINFAYHVSVFLHRYVAQSRDIFQDG